MSSARALPLLLPNRLASRPSFPDACEAGKEKATPDKNIYYWEPKSLRIRTINWWHVFHSQYIFYLYNLAIMVLGALMLRRLWNNRFEVVVLGVQTLLWDATAREAVAVAAIGVAYLMRMKPNVYLVEHSVFVPPQSWQVTHSELEAMMRAQGSFDEESMQFLKRVLERSATGESTHWPPAWHPSKDGETKAIGNLAAAREEAELVIFSLVGDLLEKTGVNPKDIDFLVVNCSIFTPTPSLCAMICNKFQLRKDVRSYNLGGMGCSANVISLDLAKQLLQNEPGTRAIVVSTENLTQNLYHGSDKSMLLQNTLFRAGGAAQLLSSRKRDSLSAKYKLLYTGRTQISEDASYHCVFEQEDGDGHRGVALSKDIVKVAGHAMKHNFIALAPHVLPFREQLRTLVNRALITLAGRAKKAGFTGLSPPAAYTPNFSAGIDHFCIHAGGRAVIEGVQKNLGLQEHHVEPSKQTLYDWGNTSSSSIWYEAEWIERLGNIRRGDRVLQVAFGSGFKCNSAVWLTLRVDHKKRGVPLKPSKHGEDDNGARAAALEVLYGKDVVNKAH